MMAKDCSQVGGNSSSNNNGSNGEGGDKDGGGFKSNCNFCGKPGHIAHDCFSNLELSKFKGAEKEAEGSSVDLLIPSVEEELGVKFMLSSLVEELETVQGESEHEEQPSVAVSGTRRQLVEYSSNRTARYAGI